MKPGDAQELVKTISELDNDKAPDLIQGTVSVVGSTTVDVDFGLGAVTGLAYLSWYRPVVNDTVWALRNGADYLVVGPLRPTGPSEYALSEPYVQLGARNGTTRPDTVANAEYGVSIRAVLGSDGGYPTSGLLMTAYDGNYIWQLLKHPSTGATYIRGGDDRSDWQSDGWQQISAATWRSVSFLNGWVNYGGSFQTARYRMEANAVRIEGLVKSGTIDAAIFILPTGYRPTGQTVFTCMSNGGQTRVDVWTSGEVFVYSQGSGSPTGWLSLSGISFGLG